MSDYTCTNYLCS